MAAPDTDQTRSHWHYNEMNDIDFDLRRGSLIIVLVVFLVIFLLALLSLYIRWVCTRPRMAVDATQQQQQPPSSRGLDTCTIDNLPVMCLEVLRKTEGKDSYECSICITGMLEGEKVRVLPACSHAFHPECVDEWLRSRSNCPLCRAALGGAAVAQQPAVVVAADP